MLRACLLLMLIAPLAIAETPIIPIKDVKPGLLGECKTVFSGTEVKSFHFRVEGIGWDNVGPGRDTIWCRMLDDPTGAMVIAAGMSGSPCYVDGKLMGALAYGWTFNKDPIFGVQPIESMLAVPNDYGDSPKKHPGVPRRGRPVVSETEAAETAWPMKLFSDPAYSPLKPRPDFEIPIPIQFGNINPLANDAIMTLWRKYGLTPMRAGSGRARRPFKTDLVPGATAAGVMSQGDFTAAGTGTMTWRDGDKVLLFGHPFTGRGKVTMPLAQSEIVGVVSSYERSFKMSNLGEIVGTINDDRLTACAGVVGPKPRMIPMSLTIRYPKETKTYKFEFINDEFFAPMIYLSSILEFFANTLQRSGDATIRMKGEIKVKDFPAIRIDQLATGQNSGWLVDLLMNSGQEISALYNTELYPFQIESVELEADAQPFYDPVTIQDIQAYPTEVKPGGTVSGWVTLKHFREARETVPFKIKIPEEVKSGEVELRVLNAEAADRLEGRSYGLSSVKPATPQQLIDVLNDRHNTGRMYFYIVQKSPGLMVESERLSALPGSVRQMIDDSQAGRDIRAIDDAFILKESREVSGRVEGSDKVKIRIKR